MRALPVRLCGICCWLSRLQGGPWPRVQGGGGVERRRNEEREGEEGEDVGVIKWEV